MRNQAYRKAIEKLLEEGALRLVRSEDAGEWRSYASPSMGGVLMTEEGYPYLPRFERKGRRGEEYRSLLNAYGDPEEPVALMLGASNMHPRLVWRNEEDKTFSADILAKKPMHALLTHAGSVVGPGWLMMVCMQNSQAFFALWTQAPVAWLAATCACMVALNQLVGRLYDSGKVRVGNYEDVGTTFSSALIVSVRPIQKRALDLDMRIEEEAQQTRYSLSGGNGTHNCASFVIAACRDVGIDIDGISALRKQSWRDRFIPMKPSLIERSIESAAGFARHVSRHQERNRVAASWEHEGQFVLSLTTKGQSFNHHKAFEEFEKSRQEGVSGRS